MYTFKCNENKVDVTSVCYTCNNNFIFLLRNYRLELIYINCFQSDRIFGVYINSVSSSMLNINSNERIICAFK